MRSSVNFSGFVVTTRRLRSFSNWSTSSGGTDRSDASISPVRSAVNVALTFGTIGITISRTRGAAAK